METREITPHYTVAGQITPEEVREIAAAGYRSILCNRPDHEAPDQPPFAAIEAAARAEGLAVRFVPVVSGQIAPGDVAAFRDALAALPAPVLAYCRSGARCQNLWMLAQER